MREISTYTDLGESFSPGPHNLGNDQSLRRISQNDGQDQDGGRSKALPQLANNPLHLLFINESSLRPKEQHRQAIRSHVMHRFHTNRKEKNSLVPKKYRLQQKGNSSWHTIPTSSISRDGLVAGTLSPVTCPTSNDYTLDMEKTGSHSSPRPSLALYGGGTFRSSSTPSCVPPTGPCRPSSGLCDILNQWSFDTTTPYALTQADGAPILCISSRDWPFPEPLGDMGPKPSIWLPDKWIPVPDVRSQRCCMLKNAQVLPFVYNTEEYFRFKVDTIKWVNSRLADPALAINDATIGSILLLSCFEMGRENIAESVHHIDGVQRIVNMRGGIDKFLHNRHFLIKILLHDLMVSLWSNTQPRFSSKEYPYPTLLPENILGARSHRVPDSPLCSNGTLRDVLHDSEFSEENINILQCMQDLSNFRSVGEHNESLKSAPKLLRAEIAESDPYSLLRIVRLAAKIYVGAFKTPPIPFSSTVNKTAVRQLSRALESEVNDATWDHYPGIFSWILLTAAAASEADGSRFPFLQFLLMGIGLGSGYGWFREFSLAIHTFRNVKHRAEGILVT